MPKQPYHNQTAARTLAVLERLAERGGAVPLTDLAAALECSKSSLFPILRTMEEAGFVRRISSGGYVLTSHLLDLGTRSMNPRHIHRAFDDASAPAVATGGELMLLAVLDGPWAVCVATRAPGVRPVALGIGLGQRFPANASAVGKALLADLSNEEIHERMGGEALQRETSATVVSLEALLEDLDHVRETGVAEDWQELEEGVAGMATVVRDRLGATVAAVGFAVPTSRATPEAWGKLRRLLLGAAADIASRIGGAPAAVL